MSSHIALLAARRLMRAFPAFLGVLLLLSLTPAWAQGPAPNFIVSATRLQTNENGSVASFSIRLTTQPTTPVAITYTTSNPQEGVFLVNNVRQNSITVTFSPNASAANGYSRFQEITIVGVDDTPPATDGTVPYTLNPTADQNPNTDPAYRNLIPPTISVQNVDNETPNLTITPSAIVVFEGQTSGFNVVLTQQPSDIVRFTLTEGATNQDEIRLNTTELVFSPANFNTPHFVSVTGIQDNIKDGDKPFSIIISNAVSTDPLYNGKFTTTVDGTIVDTSLPGITIQAPGIVTRETESGDPPSTAGFNVVLDTRPQPNTVVNFTVTSGDTSEGTVSPATLSFSPNDAAANAWNKPQRVTVTSVNDNLMDGDVTYDINVTINTGTTTDADYKALGTRTVSVTNLDNEKPGIVVSRTYLTTTEAAGPNHTAQFTVRLTGPPSSTVTYPFVIDTSGAAAGEGRLSTSSLTFTAADFFVPQTVTVTGLDDFVDDGNVTYFIYCGPAQSADPAYNGRFPVRITVVNADDDNPPGLVVSRTYLTTTEAAGPNNTASFTVRLTGTPNGTVTYPLVIDTSGGAAGEGRLSRSSLTFNPTNFSTPQTVTVTGLDDDVADGNVTYFIYGGPAQSVDPAYNGRFPVRITVVNADDDRPGVIVTRTSTVINGTLVTTEDPNSPQRSATFTVRLASRPTNIVTLTVRSSHPSEGKLPSNPQTLTFTPQNYNVAQTVTVTGVDDPFDDGNFPYSVIISATSSQDPKYAGTIDPPDVAVINVDNDLSSINVSPTSGLTTTETGGTDSFSIVLTSKPTHRVDVTVTTRDATEGLLLVNGVQTPSTTLTFSPTEGTANSWNNPRRIVVIGKDDPDADGNFPYTIDVLPQSQDPKYNGAPTTVSVVNIDNEISDPFPPTLVIIQPGLRPNNKYRSLPNASGYASDRGTGLRTQGGVVVSLFRFANTDPAVQTSSGCFNGTNFNACSADAPTEVQAEGIGPAGNPFSNWRFRFPSLTPGTYRFRARAIDRAGRTTQEDRFFVIDPIAPIVTIGAPTANTIANQVTTISGQATDNAFGSGIRSVSVVLFRQGSESAGTTAGYLATDGTFTETRTNAANLLPTTMTPVADGGTSEGLALTAGGNPLSVTWTLNIGDFTGGTPLVPGQYFVEAVATDFANNTRGTVRTGFFLRNIGADEFLVGQTYLISLPYMDSAAINATTTPLKAFTVPPVSTDASGNTTVNYELRRFNAATQQYEVLTNSSVLRRGEGYVLQPITRGTRILRPSDDPTRVPLSASITEFPIQLTRNASSTGGDNGFNLIGFPFDPARVQTIDFLNSKVIVNGTTFNNVAAAVAAGKIGNRLFVIDPSTGGLVLKGDTIMEPFGGYFCRIFDNNVTLVLQAATPITTP